MAMANVARRRGDDFQARIFWLRATQLLDDGSPVVRVCYEQGPRAFDDIQIEYRPGDGPRDHEGKPIVREFVQCKWHARAGTFGYQDLVDPSFVNANQLSLLERALDAQRRLAPDGRGMRFELLTNWRIAPDDPLLRLIGKNSDAIDIERLFVGRTDRSAMGKVRKLWREHLNIDDDELRRLARVLAIAESPESLDSLRNRLDDRFAAVGLRRVPLSELAFLYDDLALKLLGQGPVDLDRERFREMAEREGILVDATARPTSTVSVVGVRTFMHAIDHLEARCDETLDLVRYFDGRYARREADWQERIAPELHSFLVDAARGQNRLRLVLDAHVSVAFAAGTVLSVKSGRAVEIEQRTVGRRFWSVNDEPRDAAWPALMVEEEVVRNVKNEIAVAVGLTHDVSPAVSVFVREELPHVGRILHCRPDGGPSQHSVRCGKHAWELAEKTVAAVGTQRAQGRSTAAIHLFIAGPNGFAFFLGQQRALGTVHVYEWDFEGARGGGYKLGISV